MEAGFDARLFCPVGRQQAAERRAQPDAEQVAPLLGVLPVGECRAGVQDGVVVDQLNVACVEQGTTRCMISAASAHKAIGILVRLLAAAVGAAPDLLAAATN